MTEPPWSCKESNPSRSVGRKVIVLPELYWHSNRLHMHMYTLPLVLRVHRIYKLSERNFLKSCINSSIIVNFLKSVNSSASITLTD